MSKSLFHSLSKEFDDTLDTSLYPFETKRKWKGCGVREIALELPRSSTRSDIRPFVAFLNEPVHSYPSIGPRGLHYSKRIHYPATLSLSTTREIPRNSASTIHARRILEKDLSRRDTSKKFKNFLESRSRTRESKDPSKDGEYFFEMEK